jgi:hypothetical protein
MQHCLTHIVLLALRLASTGSSLAAGQASAGAQNRAQAAAKAAPPRPWAQPRKEWGDPDLQGIRRGVGGVPVERSLAIGDQEFIIL